MRKRLPAINFLWPVDVFVGRSSSEYEKYFKSSTMKKKVGKYCPISSVRRERDVFGVQFPFERKRTGTS